MTEVLKINPDLTNEDWKKFLNIVSHGMIIIM